MKIPAKIDPNQISFGVAAAGSAAAAGSGGAVISSVAGAASSAVSAVGTAIGSAATSFGTTMTVLAGPLLPVAAVVAAGTASYCIYKKFFKK